MTCQLIVAEKPKVAKTIASALGKPTAKAKKKVKYFEVDAGGKKVIVAPAVGHVYTLVEKGKSGWNLEYPVFDIEWVPSYTAEKGAKFTKDYVKNLEELGKQCDEFVNACDYDVEGSVIGYNVIAHAVGANPKDGKVKRMHFSTLTKGELQNAYKNLEDFDSGQTNAGLTRHVLDWYYGINLSRALNSALRKGFRGPTLSVGRVQGPALKLIVDRELEIQKFVPVPYWQLPALMAFQNQGFEAMHKEEKFWEKEKAEQAFEKCKGSKQGTITKLEKKQFKQNPPNPFDLTAMQIECHGCLGISPKKTLEIAQVLYEQSLISYPRTSSNQLPPAIGYKKILESLSTQGQYANLCGKVLGFEVLKPNNGKKKDQAHPAIYPTGLTPGKLTDQEYKVYDIIVKRFLATFGEPAIRETVKAEIDVNGEPFIAKGTRTVEKNWHELYEPYVKLQETTLPGFSEGEVVDVKNISFEEKETQPPKRYTDSSIISELEKRNLGTKATRAGIIETLKNRNYVSGKPLQATELGIKTVSTLDKYSPEILDENLTRQFEEEMEEVIAGKKEPSQIEDKAEEILIKICNKFKSKEQNIGDELQDSMRKARDEQNTVGKCPVCNEGSLMIRRNPKTKKRFLGCSKYPDCKNTQPLPQRGTIKKTDKVCECGYPIINVWTKGKKIPWKLCTNIKCPLKQLNQKK